MLTCFSSFINEISRMAVEGVPSSESRWISFSATNSPVCLLRPLNTYASSAVFGQRGWRLETDPGRIVWPGAPRRRACTSAPRNTHRGVGALSQLLELLERTRMSLVHFCGGVFRAQVLYADRTRQCHRKSGDGGRRRECSRDE